VKKDISYADEMKLLGWDSIEYVDGWPVLYVWLAMNGTGVSPFRFSSTVYEISNPYLEDLHFLSLGPCHAAGLLFEKSDSGNTVR
jgi:hypothetical protein